MSSRNWGTWGGDRIYTQGFIWAMALRPVNPRCRSVTPAAILPISLPELCIGKTERFSPNRT
jgi:hypothetical protein